MSEDQDDSSKTEDPTDKRLEKAREEGNVPISMEVKSLLMLVGGVIAVAFFSPQIASGLRDTLRPFLAHPHSMPMDFYGILNVLTEALIQVGFLLLFPICILVFIAFMSVIGQVGFVFSPKRMEIKISKLNPLKGLKQLFSLKRVVEVLKSVAKLLLVAAALGLVVWPNLDWILRLPEMETEAMLMEIRIVLVLLVSTVVAVMVAVSLADAAFVRFQNTKQMKMTKQEVKDEHKQSEGDPQVKSRIRAIRMERFRQRMMTAVPQADVVITNPTHFAVALSYKVDAMAAPKVVAKGADLIAKRIRELATENNVPLVENPPLARALYATVEVDQFIPPEHYKTVAEVISYVMGLKGQK